MSTKKARTEEAIKTLQSAIASKRDHATLIGLESRANRRTGMMTITWRDSLSQEWGKVVDIPITAEFDVVPCLLTAMQQWRRKAMR